MPRAGVIRIVLDAMGGDQAPGPEVAGAVAAARADAGLAVILAGDRDVLAAELSRIGADGEPRVRVVHASQAVTMDDAPVAVFKQKPDSSLRVALGLCSAGEADGLVSAGNSGAVLSHSIFALGRLPGVERPGIAAVFPLARPAGADDPDARHDAVVLCDMGANVEVKPRMLAQFGVLGACYDRIAHGRARPRVGLLSNGTESSKGTELTRAADALLREAAGMPGVQFDYVGYVEGSSLFSGGVDVVATDGFTGNVVLKLSEGLAEGFVRMVRAALEAELGDGADAAPALAALSRMKTAIDYAEVGGAPLLGVRGVVAICHGKSDAVAIENALAGAAGFARAGLTDKLAEAIARQPTIGATD